MAPNPDYVRECEVILRGNNFLGRTDDLKAGDWICLVEDKGFILIFRRERGVDKWFAFEHIEQHVRDETDFSNFDLDQFKGLVQDLAEEVGLGFEGPYEYVLSHQAFCLSVA